MSITRSPTSSTSCTTILCRKRGPSLHQRPPGLPVVVVLIPARLPSRLLRPRRMLSVFHRHHPLHSDADITRPCRPSLVTRDLGSLALESIRSDSRAGHHCCKSYRRSRPRSSRVARTLSFVNVAALSTISCAQVSREQASKPDTTYGRLSGATSAHYSSCLSTSTIIMMRFRFHN